MNPDYTPKQRRWYRIVNAISASRYATLVVFPGYYLAVRAGNFKWSLGLIIVAAILIAGDFIDGRLARKFEVVSPEGDTLEHITDKVTLAAGLGAWFALMAQSSLAQAGNTVFSAFVMTVVVTVMIEGAIAGVTIYYRDKAKSANWLGRPKFVIQCISLLVGAIGTTWYYHDEKMLTLYTKWATLGFIVAIPLGFVSLLMYLDKYRSAPTP